MFRPRTKHGLNTDFQVWNPCSIRVPSVADIRILCTALTLTLAQKARGRDALTLTLSQRARGRDVLTLTLSRRARGQDALTLTLCRRARGQDARERAQQWHPDRLAPISREFFSSIARQPGPPLAPKEAVSTALPGV